MIWTITDNRGGKTRTVGYRRAVARAWRLSLDGRSVFVGRWKPGRRLDFIAGPTFRYGRRDDVLALGLGVVLMPAINEERAA